MKNSPTQSKPRTNNTNAITHGVYSHRIDPGEAYATLAQRAANALKVSDPVQIRRVARALRDLGKRKEAAALRIAATAIEHNRTGTKQKPKLTMSTQEFSATINRLRADAIAEPQIQQLRKLQSLIEQGRLTEARQLLQIMDNPPQEEPIEDL